MTEAITLTVGNLKGGVGKTTTATQLAFTLAQKGYKILLADLDPQSNSTNILLKTKLNFDKDANTQINFSLMESIRNKDLSKSLINITNNLDLLGSSADFALFPRYEEQQERSYQRRVELFSKLLKPLKNNYDYIIIDVPPTISLITDCALYASDWVLIVVQTQQQSFDGATSFLSYIQDDVIDQFKAPNLDLAGFLPVMLEKRSSVDQTILHDLKERYGSDNVLNTVVPFMARLKRFGITGITVDGYYDKQVAKVYKAVTDEVLERINND